MLEILKELLPWLAGLLSLSISLVAASHAILYKRDIHSTVGWVGVSLLVPGLGGILYWLLGINRVRRKAGRRRPGQTLTSRAPTDIRRLVLSLRHGAQHLQALARLVDQVARSPAVFGNRVEPLYNGDEAYPCMLDAIESAEKSVALTSYIFDNDPVGQEFCQALGRAMKRGVEVRVMVDAIGLRYTWPSIWGRFRGVGLRAAKFFPTVPWPLRMPYLNLRNHRKIMVVDGKIGFTGGMNIREGHVLQGDPEHPVRDLHFRMEGPIVRHLMLAFSEDWSFCTGESLEGELWFPRLEPCGTVVARGILDGPDENFEKLRWTILGALACARSSVRIVTPYFIPDQALITSLNVAAMRGVEVDIILPENNNLAMVKHASNAQMWQILEHGCRVHMNPGIFDHTKLMIVDDSWALVGSANWDPRSLRLNFEFNVECYDSALVAILSQHVQEKLKNAHLLTKEELRRKTLRQRLHEGLFRLISPYL